MKSAVLEEVADLAAIARDRLSRIIDALADAILLLDGRGNTLHANAAACRVFAGRHRDLAAIVSAARLKLRARHLNPTAHRPPGYRGCRDAPDQGVVVVTTADGIRHICTATPLPADETAPQAFDDAPLHLFVIRATDRTGHATKVVQALFGLTDRERDVLFALIEIGGVPDIAPALNISLGTTRSHVKALFAKTGTRRQSDLVRLVAEMASPFALAAAAVTRPHRETAPPAQLPSRHRH